MTLDQIARAHGFSGDEELARLVLLVPLERPGVLVRYDTWRLTDWSRDGLVALLRECGIEPALQTGEP